MFFQLNFYICYKLIRLKQKPIGSGYDFESKINFKLRLFSNIQSKYKFFNMT